MTSAHRPSNTFTSTSSCRANSGTVVSSRNIASAFRMSGGSSSRSPQFFPCNAEYKHFPERSPATVTFRPKSTLGAATSSVVKSAHFLEQWKDLVAHESLRQLSGHHRELSCGRKPCREPCRLLASVADEAPDDANAVLDLGKAVVVPGGRDVPSGNDIEFIGGIDESPSALLSEPLLPLLGSSREGLQHTHGPPSSAGPGRTGDR